MVYEVCPMSERTEQLILMLTPEEKARLERRANEGNRTPAEYLLDLFREDETAAFDQAQDIEANLRQAVRDIRDGKTREITSIWDILDKQDDFDE